MRSKTIFRENTSTQSDHSGRQKLRTLSAVSQKELFHAKAVFPFDFFPDELSVEAAQVNIVVKDLFSQEIHSIPIKNITDCVLLSSPFFASLKFIDVSFVQNSIEIKYLKKSDASRARRIVQGLMVASKENVDISGHHPSEIIKHVEEIGAARPHEDSEDIRQQRSL